jgi:hypothetical protein
VTRIRYAAELQEVRETYASASAAAPEQQAAEEAGGVGMQTPAEMEAALRRKDAEIEGVRRQLRELGDSCEHTAAAARRGAGGGGGAAGAGSGEPAPTLPEEGIPPVTSG